eukprot:91376-Pelagomonas_calceolata.AAC.6
MESFRAALPSKSELQANHAYLRMHTSTLSIMHIYLAVKPFPGAVENGISISWLQGQAPPHWLRKPPQPSSTPPVLCMQPFLAGFGRTCPRKQPVGVLPCPSIAQHSIGFSRGHPRSGMGHTSLEYIRVWHILP